ncbi:Uncharacterised protein [Vibrio cholerae]|nr:Uncharacterised protein [Vibrio cholerae]
MSWWDVGLASVWTVKDLVISLFVQALSKR